MIDKKNSTILDFTLKGFSCDEIDSESLGLLIGDNYCVLKNIDPDYIKIANTFHKGVRTSRRKL